jgi:hypothetical protein
MSHVVAISAPLIALIGVPVASRDAQEVELADIVQWDHFKKLTDPPFLCFTGEKTRLESGHYGHARRRGHAAHFDASHSLLHQLE